MYEANEWTSKNKPEKNAYIIYSVIQTDLCLT